MRSVNQIINFSITFLFYRNTHTQPDVFITEDNTAYGLTVFSQDTTDIDDHPSDYSHVYDIPQQ